MCNFASKNSVRLNLVKIRQFSTFAPMLQTLTKPLNALWMTRTPNKVSIDPLPALNFSSFPSRVVAHGEIFIMTVCFRRKNEEKPAKM